jgi:hypothetical protein
MWDDIDLRCMFLCSCPVIENEKGKREHRKGKKK